MFYSVNSYSSASSRKGISGLMSGMDVDEIVEKMTTGTRGKIASQLQKKQLAQWRQDAYREVTTCISEFKNKYLSFSSGKNNILSSDYFDTRTIENTSSYVKVSGNTNAAKNIVIKDITKLAETASFTSNKKVSSQEITSGVVTSSWDKSVINGQSIQLDFGGTSYNLTVGSSFSFANGLDDSGKLQAIADEFNKSIDGNSELKDKIKFEVNAGQLQIKSLDGTSELKVVGGDEKLLTGLGISAGATGTSIDGTSSASSLFETKSLSDTLAGSTLTVNFNGVSKAIKFDETDKASYGNSADLKTYIQGKLDTLYGSGKITIQENSGKLSFKTSNSNDIFAISSSDQPDVLGQNGVLHIDGGSSTRITWNTSIKSLIQAGQFADSSTMTAVDGKYQITVNDVKIEVSENATMRELIDKINNSDAGVEVTYSTTSDTFSMKASESGLNGKVNLTVSAETNDLSKVLFGEVNTNYTLKAGEDAVLNVSFDGGATTSTVTRSTNKFSLDGLNIELLGKTSEEIKFNVKADSDTIHEKIKTFLDDYNAMVKLANGKISEKSKRDFKPLTEEQKKDMSEDEIKKWEAKAKEGLLQNDRHLTNFLNSLRQSMFSSVQDSTITLNNLGISTTDWQENGELHIVDEKKLIKVLNEDPEAVTNLFTKYVEPEIPTGASKEQINKAKSDAINKSGLAHRLDYILNATAGTFGGDGVLITIAGNKGDYKLGQDRLSREMKSIDRELTSLKRKLETQETRYYKQFSSLETALNKMNMQSSWLTQQYGGGQ